MNKIVKKQFKNNVITSKKELYPKFPFKIVENYSKQSTMKSKTGQKNQFLPIMFKKCMGMV